MKRLLLIFAIMIGVAFVSTANVSVDHSSPPTIATLDNHVAITPANAVLDNSIMEISGIVPIVAMELQDPVVEVKEASPLLILKQQVLTSIIILNQNLPVNKYNKILFTDG